MKSIKERLIDATFEEVYSKGYTGASLSNILAKAETKKGSMYYYFDSKKDMALSMIEQKVTCKIDEYWSSLNNVDKDILDHLTVLLKDTSNKDFKRGCPLGNLLQEGLIDDEEFSTLLNKILDEWKKLFINVLEKAIANKEIRKVNVESVAVFLIAVIEGALLVSKKDSYSTNYDLCMEQLEIYLNSLKVKD
jgi:TetR/AcrR family transcriptional repressor of nem operon